MSWSKSISRSTSAQWHALEQLFDFGLPIGLRELLALQILAQLIDVAKPFDGDRLDLVGQQIVPQQRFQKREGQQAAKRLAGEIAS